MFRLPILTAIFSYIGLNCIMMPAQAESINVNFTGIVEERILIYVSSSQPGELAIITSSPHSVEIPPTPHQKAPMLDSSQAVSIILNSTQITERVIQNPLSGKTNLQLPLTNFPQSHITIVPQ